MAVAIVLLSSCGSRPQLQDGPIALRASDGVSLAAHHYVPLNANPPGLILIHRAGGNSSVWEAFAVRAQQTGYLVVTVDLRGHGESAEYSNEVQGFREFSKANWQDTALDLDAALDLLLELGVDSRDVFLVGEGFGANLALQYTVEHPAIQAVVLLSAGAEYHGIWSAPLLERLSRRPTLLLWSRRDEYAASCAATLQRRATGHLEVRVYPGTSHGADIFATSPESMGQVLIWLEQMRLKPRPIGD